MKKVYCFLFFVLMFGNIPCRAGFLLLQYEYQRACAVAKLKSERNLNFGTELFKQGKYEEAIPYLYDYAQLQGGWLIANEMTFMTEAQRRDYWEKHKTPFTEYMPMLAYMTHADSIVAEAYNSVLLSKGILLNASTTMRQFIHKANDKSLEELYEKYASLKEVYEKNLSDTVLSNTEDIVKIGAEVDSIGAILKSRIPMDRFAVLLNLRWTDIQESMNEDDAAIEFIDFPMMDGRKMYAALVLRKEFKTPVMEPLFSSEQLTIANTYPYVDESKAYHLIWKKLVPYLDGVSNVFFSPIGILHKVALEYLPDEQSLPINWLFSMHRLSSTREIITARTLKNSNLRSILFGGLNYTINHQKKNLGNKKDVQDAMLERTVDDLRVAVNQEVEYLPGTFAEIQSISNGFKEHGILCEIFSGDEGTEDSFRKLSGQPINIVHIATHGFYLPANIRNDSVIGVSDEEVMMLRSGLFMAGANQALQKDDNSFQTIANDGIVTAKEVSQLDFANADLVTLSACETALGDIDSDGVFGLQRGFKKAGVQSELVSLWPVNDEATSVFMTSFYKYYLTLNKKYRALQLAQQALCRSYGGKYNDPRYWGAFILIDGIDFSNEKIKQNAALIDSIQSSRHDLYQRVVTAKNHSEQEVKSYKIREAKFEEILLDVWNSRKEKADNSKKILPSTIKDEMKSYGLE